MDWHVGAAYWPFKDFSTPLRPENPIPYVNQKGVVERDLTKKEAYFVFQSYWTKEPVVHIYGHTYPVRWGEKDEEKLIKVYSNCKKVELFLNGQSYGEKYRDSQNFPAAGLRWKTPFKEGKNRIIAKAVTPVGIISDTLDFFYQTEKWSEATLLKLQELKRYGNIVEVEAKAFDKNHVFCPDAKNKVRFEVAGDGELLDNQGTSTGSAFIELYNGRAIIKVKLKGDNTIVAVKSDGLKTGIIEL